MSRCTMPIARSTTSYAVLGLLSVRTWTTYELAKQVQRSLKWFWPRAERKLYDEPKALVAAGLARASKQYTGQRASTLYEITPEGRAALGAWLDEPSAPPQLECEAMLKVFFADGGSLPQLQRTLERLEAESAERLRALGEMASASVSEGTAFPERLHISAVALRLQARQELALLEWTRWARRQVARWRSTTDPGRWSAPGAIRELGAEIEAVLANT